MVKLPPLGRRKRIASLFLLPQCDMTCRFCASESEFSVMTFEQAVGLLEALREQGIRNVVFGGGEPTLWPHDPERLCGVARRLGFFVQLCTNGVGLGAALERRPEFDRCILPLESMDPAVHDALRQLASGHHALVLRRIAELSDAKVELSLATVVTRENLSGLTAIGEHLTEARRSGAAIHAWHLYRFLPVGRAGRAQSERLGVSRAEYLGACASARAAAKGYSVYRRNNMLRSRSVEFFWFEGRRLRVGFEPPPDTGQDG